MTKLPLPATSSSPIKFQVPATARTAVARAVAGTDVRDALQSTDAAELAAEVKQLSDHSVGEVRGLLARCGADPEPVPLGQLADLGLLV